MWRWIGVVMMMRMQLRVGSDGCLGAGEDKIKIKKTCNFLKNKKKNTQLTAYECSVSLSLCG